MPASTDGARGRMEFRILGPLEVHGPDGPVALGGAKQRALLALLLLRRGEVVSSDTLIDELWGERPPATAAKSVQVYVSHLRKALRDGLLETRGRGYALRLEPEQLDLDRFERLLEQGTDLLAAGDARRAAETLRAALALWRGPPLADLAYESFVQAEAARLQELRLSALEARIEADLALGRHGELVPELDALVRQHPLRERLRGQLMLALYRSGRQAEALEAYREARRALVDEMGLEPGRALQELERAILRQDPQLDPPARPLLAGRARASRRGLFLVVVGASFLVAAAIAAALVELTRKGGAELVAATANSVAAVDPETNRLVADVPVGITPTSIAVDEDAVWVLNADDRTVSRIDSASGTVVKTFATGGDPTDLAVGEGAVWVGSGAPAASSQVFGSLVPVALTRIDPRTAVLAGRIPLPRLGSGPGGVGGRWPGQRQIAAGHGAVWAIDAHGTIARIDPQTNRIVARIRGLQASSLALGNDGLWVATDDNVVARVDPRTNTIRQKVKLATFFLSGIATGAGAVWVTDPFAGTLWRIDPRPGPVARTIAVGVGASAVATGAGAVWVVNTLDATILRVDPETNRVVARISVGGTPREIAVGGGRVWLSVALGAGATQPVSGAPRAETSGALPASACGPVSYGGAGSPQFLIVSSLPLQSGPRGSSLPMAQAIEFVLARHGFRAAKYTVGYQSCDDSTAQTGGEDPAKCIGNAQAFAAARKVIGVIGPYGSGCAGSMIPILNRAPGGPLAMISITNSYPGLTRRTPEAPPGEPASFYPTGVRNYARLSPADDYQAAAHALLARELDLERVFVLRGELGSPYGALLAHSFERAARRLGIRIVGSAAWDAKGPSYRPLVAKVLRARPDAVFFGGVVFDNAGPLLRELRTALGAEVTFLAPDGFAVIPYLRQVAGSAAEGMYVSFLGAPNSALGPAGRRFLREFAATQPGGAVPSFSASYAAQATEVLLEAIARSDGTRASVASELLKVRIDDGILGTFRIDGNGDPTLNPITILRVTGADRPSPTLLSDHAGTTIDRVITPPRSLVRSR